jgi:hypothetical protein
MTTLRWLLHSARCWFHRWQARDALDCIEVAQIAQKRERERMHKALAHEEQEQRAWDRYRKSVREAAQ